MAFIEKVAPNDLRMLTDLYYYKYLTLISHLNNTLSEECYYQNLFC